MLNNLLDGFFNHKSSNQDAKKKIIIILGQELVGFFKGLIPPVKEKEEYYLLNEFLSDLKPKELEGKDYKSTLLSLFQDGFDRKRTKLFHNVGKYCLTLTPNKINIEKRVKLMPVKEELIPNTILIGELYSKIKSKLVNDYGKSDVFVELFFPCLVKTYFSHENKKLKLDNWKDDFFDFFKSHWKDIETVRELKIDFNKDKWAEKSKELFDYFEAEFWDKSKISDADAKDAFAYAYEEFFLKIMDKDIYVRNIKGLFVSIMCSKYRWAMTKFKDKNVDYVFDQSEYNADMGTFDMNISLGSQLNKDNYECTKRLNQVLRERYFNQAELCEQIVRDMQHVIDLKERGENITYKELAEEYDMTYSTYRVIRNRCLNRLREIVREDQKLQVCYAHLIN